MPNATEYDSISQQASLDFTPQLAPSPSQAPSRYLPGPLTHFDAFQHATLRKPIIDVAVATEVFKQLGSLEKIREMIASYFEGIHKRLPIISPQRFQARLSSYGASSPASFTTLFLCMQLLQESPVTDADSMQSNLYLTAKSIISLMEGAGYNDLDAIQCRVMIAFFELGHSIYPAASVSIASCARLARAIGLDKGVAHEIQTEEKVVLEEQRRVWWAVVNLDR